MAVLLCTIPEKENNNTVFCPRLNVYDDFPKVLPDHLQTTFQLISIITRPSLLPKCLSAVVHEQNQLLNNLYLKCLWSLIYFFSRFSSFPRRRIICVSPVLLPFLSTFLEIITKTRSIILYCSSRKTNQNRVCPSSDNTYSNNVAGLTQPIINLKWNSSSAISACRLMTIMLLPVYVSYLYVCI